MYGRGRKLDRAAEMFNTARSLGLSLDEKAYMNLIGYYGKAGNIMLIIFVPDRVSYFSRWCYLISII